MRNYVKEIYAPFSDEEISEKIAALLTPATTRAKVQIVYQNVGKDYMRHVRPIQETGILVETILPREGTRQVNQAFIDWVEKNYQF